MTIEKLTVHELMTEAIRLVEKSQKDIAKVSRDISKMAASFNAHLLVAKLSKKATKKKR